MTVSIWTEPLIRPSLVNAVRPCDVTEQVPGVDDALLFLVGKWRFVRNAVRANRRLQVGTHGVSGQPFPIHAEPKESAQRAETFALGIHSGFPGRIETSMSADVN